MHERLGKKNEERKNTIKSLEKGNLSLLKMIDEYDSRLIDSNKLVCYQEIALGVLSRVRTRKGLFLMRPLDMNRDFSFPQKLLDFEARMKRCKEQPILDKLSRASV